MAKASFICAAAMALLPTGAAAQQKVVPDPSLDALLSRFSDEPYRFTQTDGAALYRTTCQACHMEDGQGAIGAGAHPPLAGNPKMISRHYIAGIILTGYHGMPRFGDTMSNEQIAEITNYVRTHFGNDFPEVITPAEVDALRASD
jgi:mono/diheme cytochrome c family protein